MFKKTRKKINKALGREITRKMSTSLSDNEEYPHFCLRASHDYRVFNQFRSNPVYRRILEHTSEELVDMLDGAEILDESPQTGPNNCIIVWEHK